MMFFTVITKVVDNKKYKMPLFCVRVDIKTSGYISVCFNLSLFLKYMVSTLVSQELN